MEMGVHGGDIYRNPVQLDFSVNVNPFGMPETVRRALHRAVAACGCYPDMEASALTAAVSRFLGVPKAQLLFGNGASELFMAIARGICPDRTLIPAPSFYGYAYASQAAGSRILYHTMRQEDGFTLTERLFDDLTADVALLWLANPNNPTGVLLPDETLRRIAAFCETRGIYLVLDESFIDFSGEAHSMVGETEAFPHLLVVRSFTKSFAIPGVRLGALVCGDAALRRRIGAQLPEWNLSAFAQAAGCACAEERAYLCRMREAVGRERAYLTEALTRSGYTVFPSAANFLLFYDAGTQDGSLYERMLAQGILIRNCENFEGLRGGFYRIAVRSREENERLLQALDEAQRRRQTAQEGAAE